MRRRDLVRSAALAWGAAAGAGVVRASPTAAVPPSAARAELLMAQWIGGRPVDLTGIRLDLSELVENGHDVPLRVEVDSPMTADHRVTALSVWAPGNPQALSLEVEFGRFNPRAEVAARIRLATSQRVTALAALSDGRVRRADVSVVVALAACVDGS